MGLEANVTENLLRRQMACDCRVQYDKWVPMTCVEACIQLSDVGQAKVIYQGPKQIV